ncbi:hypothetical protein COCVIDRAFT_18061 [Bipolaris victoriae FI3]|uniref:Uncharacterized protein n=1 Tax=Bipolaris victoriae (strain FI3) TaxID=930091 RepID=W7ECA7_BIPV3|nr:hypothetical protein COCVIDRAFT_18061 [Bipolaris victoriae FI3]
MGMAGPGCKASIGREGNASANGAGVARPARREGPWRGACVSPGAAGERTGRMLPCASSEHEPAVDRPCAVPMQMQMQMDADASARIAFGLARTAGRGDPWACQCQCRPSNYRVLLLHYTSSKLHGHLYVVRRPRLLTHGITTTKTTTGQPGAEAVTRPYLLAPKGPQMSPPTAEPLV